MRLVAAALIAVTTAAPAFSQDRGSLARDVSRRYTAAYDSCIESAPSVMGMVDCVVEEIEIQDASLNRAYRNVMVRLPRARREKLRAVERAWIARRDPVCKADALKRDGSIHTTMYALMYWDCILDATIRRTILIERYGSGRGSLAALANDLP
jgi:uncharacterized protein YecT (DUF1311 family)